MPTWKQGGNSAASGRPWAAAFGGHPGDGNHERTHERARGKWPRIKVNTATQPPTGLTRQGQFVRISSGLGDSAEVHAAVMRR